MSPDDQNLRRALREVPPMTAPPGFTESVLRRAANGEAAGRRAPWSGRRTSFALALAAVALAIALGLGTWGLLHDRTDSGAAHTAELAPGGLDARAAASEQPSSARDRLDEMRREHELLRRDLESLREVTRPDSPYLYLGGDERVEFVWGLEEAPARPVAYRPASF